VQRKCEDQSVFLHLVTRILVVSGKF